MTRKIAVVGSKSLDGYASIYAMIDEIILSEVERGGPFILVNGGEEGVDLMAAELAMSHGLEYEMIPLEECAKGCTPESKYDFEHSFKPRSRRIASEASKVYRIYDEGCGKSTCEVTAGFADELGKEVLRIPVDVLTIVR